MIILPAIDLRGGRCVRLQQGDFSRETVFDADPVAVARRFEEAFQAQGVPPAERWLHVVDLDGAKTGRPVHLDVVRRVIEAVPTMQVELGGGIRSTGAAEKAFEAGVKRVIVGTQAVRDPKWFKEVALRYPGRVLLGLDTREAKVAVAGWGEATERTVVEVINQIGSLPLAAIVYTAIERDGMMAGPDFTAMTVVATASPWPVIASGGVTSAGDIRRLREIGCAGAIIGRALYEGKLTLEKALAAAREKQVGGSDG
jgi:phosphoribosylformimino-5-aminoimidazole carboxamide ribotide isomerase